MLGLPRVEDVLDGLPRVVLLTVALPAHLVKVGVRVRVRVRVGVRLGLGLGLG